jgi:hypothetical protein
VGEAYVLGDAMSKQKSIRAAFATMAVILAGFAPAYADQTWLGGENEVMTPFVQPIIMKGHGKSSDRTVLLAPSEGKVDMPDASPVIKNLRPIRLPSFSSPGSSSNYPR